MLRSILTINNFFSSDIHRYSSLSKSLWVGAVYFFFNQSSQFTHLQLSVGIYYPNEEDKYQEHKMSTKNLR